MSSFQYFILALQAIWYHYLHHSTSLSFHQVVCWSNDLSVFLVEGPEDPPHLSLVLRNITLGVPVFQAFDSFMSCLLHRYLYVKSAFSN